MKIRIKKYMEKIFSYRLSVFISPDWENIYKKICNIEEEEFKKHLKEKFKTYNENSDLYGSKFEFTEYYDSASGLIFMFQKTTLKNGKIIFFDTLEFGAFGHIFESDRNSSITIDDSTINVGYTLGVGGVANEESLFILPTEKIFNFLMALRQKFPEDHHNLDYLPIVKFPDGIEKELKDRGIKNHIEHLFYNPNDKNYRGLESDKNFFEQMGRPIISYHFDGCQYLSSNMVSHCSIKLKTFRQGENDRVSPECITTRYFQS